MLPKKYHAIIFIGVLVMLLLLGIHLLGIGYTSGQATAKTAALARNSTSQTSSSSIVNTALSNQNNLAYRHPIVYDKLTGATNNQINEVLGAKPNEYPIDHYQQQLQQQQQQQQHSQINQPFNRAFNPLAQDEFFGRQPQMVEFLPQLTRHMPPMMGNPTQMLTTLPPSLMQQQPIPLPPLPPPAPPNSQQRAPPTQRQQHFDANSNPNSPIASAGSLDSVPSASSLNNDGTRPNNSASQQQQPIFYTPPIFAYNNFDQTRPINEIQLAPYSFGTPNQQPQQRRNQQLAPLGVPEAPLSIDEYNARQNRLRLMSSQQPQLASTQRSGAAGAEPQYSVNPNGSSNQVASNQQSVNLLADPQQQQRHKQQMLDRQLLFNSSPFLSNPPTNNQSSSHNLSNYYPDPALYRMQPANNLASIRAPYAQNLGQPAQSTEQALANARANQPTQGRVGAHNHRVEAQPMKQQLIKNANSQQVPASSNLVADSQMSPNCARHQLEFSGGNLESVNSSLQLPVLFCNEDQEYPIKEVMRALEVYASERSIEQLLPQLLVQIYLSQRVQPSDGSALQLTLDALQPSINNQIKPPSGESPPDHQQVTFDDSQQQQRLPSGNNLFPSANYEPLCKSNIYMTQPRRAKNLFNQWKIVVNLPGHKYRGIAISQMIRVEECTRPNTECASNLSTATGTRPGTPQQLFGPKSSRCLQHYGNQRLVSWSQQQGLHLDIFRVPIACSCHIRR